MTDLKSLGYYFDEEGVLRTIKDDETFKFTTQEAYEQLGEAVTEEVYKLLEDKCKLERIPLKPPNSNDKDEDVSFIFASKNFEKSETLLVLIHGSGVVRAGQWARRLIINENLTTGTQFPYINRAIDNGWGVIVFNTNHNGTEYEELQYSETPVKHATNAWNWFVKSSKAKNIYVVAHSRGGYDISCVLQKFGDDDRMTKICLTDSPCFNFPSKMENRTKPLIVVNFLAQGKIDSAQFVIPSYKYTQKEVIQLHAGTRTHESSSHCSIDSVFHIFENTLTKKTYMTVMEEAKQLVVKKPENTEKTKEEEKEEGEPALKKKKCEV